MLVNKSTKGMDLSDDDLENVSGGYSVESFFFVSNVVFNKEESEKFKEKGYDLAPGKKYTLNQLESIFGTDFVSFKGLTDYLNGEFGYSHVTTERKILSQRGNTMIVDTYY